MNMVLRPAKGNRQSVLCVLNRSNTGKRSFSVDPERF